MKRDLNCFLGFSGIFLKQLLHLDETDRYIARQEVSVESSLNSCFIFPNYYLNQQTIVSVESSLNSCFILQEQIIKNQKEAVSVESSLNSCFIYTLLRHGTMQKCVSVESSLNSCFIPFTPEQQAKVDGFSGIFLKQLLHLPYQKPFKGCS